MGRRRLRIDSILQKGLMWIRGYFVSLLRRGRVALGSSTFLSFHFLVIVCVVNALSFVLSSLTGADTVIFYDSDFNPQMDRQCEDRYVKLLHSNLSFVLNLTLLFSELIVLVKFGTSTSTDSSPNTRSRKPSSEKPTKNVPWMI